MIPIARTEKLLIQEVGNEVIVYDQENDSSHCLNPMAARVWELCDGQNTINDIAKLLEKELNISKDSDVDMRGLVWLTLEELERYHLIKDYVKQPIGASVISRRQVVKTATLVGGFAIGSMFPLVKSIVAPNPAMAGSPPCVNTGTVRRAGQGIGATALGSVAAASTSLAAICAKECCVKYTVGQIVNSTTRELTNGNFLTITEADCICSL